jgi:hypothetical protein
VKSSQWRMNSGGGEMLMHSIEASRKPWRQVAVRERKKIQGTEMGA